MGVVNATTGHDTSSNPLATFRLYGALIRSGFRRYATYRQATVAGAVTNTVFGFLRCYVLLAVAAGAGGVAAGYRGDQLATYVWFGQGLLAVVLLWGWTDLADRIRSGEVATDLLRPVHPVTLYLATDLGRAGYAMLTRFVPPVLVGALAFDLYIPSRPGTWPLFAISMVLAVVACFACRYLVNATAYWLLDLRGVTATWVSASAVLGGLNCRSGGTGRPGRWWWTWSRRCRSPVSVDGARLVATESDGHRLVYALTGASAGALVGRLAAVGSLRDLAVVEPAIEDVVTRLYRSA